MDIEILFQDNHLFAINKVAGLLTQPSGTDQDSAETQAKQWIKEHYKKPGNVFLEAIHRLDKPVSGIVLFARTSKALSRLQAAMRSKQTKKIYFALVEGHLNNLQGFLENHLVHDDYFARVIPSQTPDSKLARLKYQVVREYPHCSLVEIELETGRYHQIRAQFSALGHPIIGDKKYGSKHSYIPEGIALHHAKLQIPHPISGQLMTFEAPLPELWIKQNRSSTL